jgi:flagellar motility protein MotE (MotC chaperone)
MIVTRQRKQKKSSLPILLPIAAIAMLGVALAWPPSRNIILNGPLKPFSNIVLSFWGTVSRPLTFAYQQQEITDRNIQVKQLNDQLEADRKTSADKDQQVQSLQRAVAAANAQPPEVTPSPAPVVRPAAAAAAGGAVALSAISPERAALQKTGQQWAAMDPEKAAALIGTLPDDYVAQVFAQMSPDDVGPIMDNLSAKQAARIVQSSQAQISAPTRR